MRKMEESSERGKKALHRIQHVLCPLCLMNSAAVELLLQKTRSLLLSDNGGEGQMVSLILVTNGAMLSYGENSAT